MTERGKPQHVYPVSCTTSPIILPRPALLPCGALVVVSQPCSLGDGSPYIIDCSETEGGSGV